jgi:predicted RNA-binding protein YlxR (DUF448 family)/ribosomal protein L30E
MVAIRPEYFYHPAVGVLSPATLGIYTRSIVPAPPLSSPSQQPDPAVSEMPRHAARKTMSLAKAALCAVTEEILPTTQMIRFVITPDLEVVPDFSERLPGKFIWIKADRSVLQKAIWRNSFASSAKEAVIVPKDLLERVDLGLNAMALQSLNLARRAGEFRQGFVKVEELLRSGEAGVYIVASDAKENGREKLERLANGLPIVDMWTIAELSEAIGEANVVHIALMQGGISRTLLNTVQKLNAMRSDLKR